MRLRPRRSRVAKVKDCNVLETRSLRLLLTGFGKFSGVERNPTQSLVKYFINRKKKGIDVVEGVNTKMKILEVSVDACDKVAEKSRANIFVHLGVNYRGTAVQLEQVAYNNMDFRVADQKGYQPKRRRIFTNRKLDQGLHSDFDLAAVKSSVVAQLQLPKGQLVLSEDPGRFLCNYIYAKSVGNQVAKKCPAYSVFVHVPPFTRIQRSRQIAIVQAVLDALLAQVAL